MRFLSRICVSTAFSVGKTSTVKYGPLLDATLAHPAWVCSGKPTNPSSTTLFRDSRHAQPLLCCLAVPLHPTLTQQQPATPDTAPPFMLPTTGGTLRSLIHLLHDDLHVFPTTLLHHLLSLAQLSHSADSGLYTAGGVSHGYFPLLFLVFLIPSRFNRGIGNLMS